jgi:nitronate monooxygenase
VQIGTAYFFCPKAKIGPVYRQALRNVKDDQTAVTNVFTGRPARAIVNRIVREVGPMSDLAPQFPLAAGAIAPLRKGSEEAGSEDFAQMWSGQSARFGRELPAGELTKRLAAEAAEVLTTLHPKAK